MTDPKPSPRLAVDIGGTFTDLVLEADGRRHSAKVLTTPRAPEQAVVTGVRELLARVGLAADAIGLLVHGTTLATNAVIERKGARTALIGSQGFRDVLDIADEGRYDQYDIFLEKPRPLVPRRLRFTVSERIDIDGEVLTPLDEAALEALAPALRELGVESVAVGFLHAYRNPVHELRAREVLSRRLPEAMITLASEVCPEIREYERLSTACANAYVQPLMVRYLKRLEGELAALGLRCPIRLMTSGGGLTTLETAIAFPIRLVESGPAGGAILAAHLAGEAGLDRVLSFDMGGTTAKICLIEHGRAQTARSFEIDRAARFLKGSGLPLRIPVIEMVEIGAGGGSMAGIDALGNIAVGPESAGAEPGPACYGRGGAAPTVTDADLALGRLDAERFAGGALRLDPERARAALARAVAEPLGLGVEMAAFGIAEMIDETMANAARVHAVERGQDLAGHTLIAFGGAAPLHAARLAEKLGIARVVVPEHAGVGSAVGFLRAPIAYEVVRSRHMPLKDFDAGTVNELFASLREEAGQVVRAAAGGAGLEEARLAYMRYVGQGHEVAVPLPVRSYDARDAATFEAAFAERYAAQFARTIPGAELECLTWSLALRAPAPAAPSAGGTAGRPRGAVPERRRLFEAWSGEWRPVDLYARDSLEPGLRLPGPCLIFENDTSTFVSPVFDAFVDPRGFLVLERRRQAVGRDPSDQRMRQ